MGIARVSTVPQWWWRRIDSVSAGGGEMNRSLILKAVDLWGIYDTLETCLPRPPKWRGLKDIGNLLRQADIIVARQVRRDGLVIGCILRAVGGKRVCDNSFGKLRHWRSQVS